jgi:L-amino acid N-acyltransferase YncA
MDSKISEINIRNADIIDADRLLKIYAYYVMNTAISFEYEVPSISEFQNRMRDKMKKYPYIVIEKDGIVQGYAYSFLIPGDSSLWL